MSAPTTTRQSSEEAVLDAVRDELYRATSKFGAFVSPHEGYAIILEEVDELWDEIKGDKLPGARGRMRKEALQIAAMGCRYLIDVRPAPDYSIDLAVGVDLRAPLRAARTQPAFASPHEAYGHLRIATRRLQDAVAGEQWPLDSHHAGEVAALAARFLLDIPEEN